MNNFEKKCFLLFRKIDFLVQYRAALKKKIFAPALTGRGAKIFPRCARKKTKQAAWFSLLLGPGTGGDRHTDTTPAFRKHSAGRESTYSTRQPTLLLATRDNKCLAIS